MPLAFNDLADLWIESEASHTTPALHGWLTGHLAAGARLQAANWLSEAKELLSLEGDIKPELHNALIEMLEWVLQGLTSQDMSYALLLPSDDDADVDEQVKY